MHQSNSIIQSNKFMNIEVTFIRHTRLGERPALNYLTDHKNISVEKKTCNSPELASERFAADAVHNRKVRSRRTALANIISFKQEK